MSQDRRSAGDMYVGKELLEEAMFTYFRLGTAIRTETSSRCNCRVVEIIYSTRTKKKKKKKKKGIYIQVLKRLIMLLNRPGRIS